MPKPILFLSDLGVRDEFVGVCHSVIASIAPGAPVIDLSHGVPPQDVQAGALTFRDCIAFAPQDSILLGVVDPGVGTDRKAVAVETASQRVLVGPDNGLLSLAWDAAGGPTRAFEITAPDVVLQPVSKVFHGRDVFAPAAAHLAAGLPPEKLGPQIDVGELVTLRLPGVDGSKVKVATTDASVNAERVSTYAEVAPGAFAVIEDAWGWITVIRFGANAAAELGVRPGDPVWLLAPDD
jgi:S-adenosylmethionine hydrolase